MSPRLAAILLLVSTLTAAAPRAADACGGCFSPPETVTAVESHRMVVSLSPEKSILWDQIRYTGDPADFVWVLPVPTPDAAVEVADDLFFAELESQTAPTINAPALPPLDCPPPPECDDCGGDAAGGGFDADAGAADDVDVYREEVVGPYQTAVIGSDDPDALVDWLNDNGYVVPESTVPTIRHYTDQDMVFVVLRLAPEQGITAMQPVRIEYPGFMGTFPLKMVTVGAYGSLQMTLWIIAEQRYDSTNYAAATIDPAALVWDFAAARSNYLDLFRQAVLDGGGRAWVTQFAHALDYLYFTSPEIDRAKETIPYPFVTRLQTDMLVDHLSADLQLGPSAGGTVDNFLTAESYVNDVRTCPDYDNDGDPDTWNDYVMRDDDDFFVFQDCHGCSAGRGGGAGLLLTLGAIVLAFRRRRARPC
ncbi:MAG TPA: DUF2330 domain-containing protein [Kofleriaceae bacterium]|nr:DUF2330 domain-containing protein [Kofleriaceae bacterium]